MSAFACVAVRDAVADAVANAVADAVAVCAFGVSLLCNLPP